MGGEAQIIFWQTAILSGAQPPLSNSAQGCIYNLGAIKMDDDKVGFFDIIESAQTIWGSFVLLIIGAGLFMAWIGTLAKPPETAISATLEAEKRLSGIEAVELEPTTDVNVDTPEVLSRFEVAKASRQISKLGAFVESYPESKKVAEAKKLAEKSLRRQGSQLAKQTYIRYFGSLPADIERQVSQVEQGKDTELTYNQESIDDFRKLHAEFYEKIRPNLTREDEEESETFGEIDYEGPRNFDGEPHGIGKMTFETGIVYEGRFENGRRTVGETRYTDGDVYTGGYDGPYPSGQGILSMNDGTVYEGNFKKGEFEGRGILKNPDGTIKYKGEFKDGDLHGRGVLNIDDGNVYEGSFKDGNLHGRGVFKYSDGTIYFEGNFKFNEIHGYGKLSFENGGYYEGDFFEGLAQGQGARYFAEGDVYKGSCKADKAHGQGTYDNPDWNEVIVGTFKAGELTDYVCRLRDSNVTYECNDYTVTVPCM